VKIKYAFRVEVIPITLIVCIIMMVVSNEITKNKLEKEMAKKNLGYYNKSSGRFEYRHTVQFEKKINERVQPKD
jgi:alpha-acetolactate decarboxylase